MKLLKYFLMVVALLLFLFLVWIIVGLINISILLSSGVFSQPPNDDEYIIADDDVGGLYVYGCFYFRGINVIQNREKGIKWIRKSAEQDFDLAQGMMAYLYFKGNGVPQNKYEARKWALKAEKNGFPIWECWAKWEQEEAEKKNENQE